MNLKNLALALSMLALLQGCGGTDDSAPAATAPPPAPATTAPATTAVAAADTKFQTLDGVPFELGTYAGKKVFVNYWATWCAPCIREIPSLARASAELEDENYVFLLASDESLDTIRNFIDEREFSGNFVKLNKFFGAWGIQGVPSSDLYDENGNLLVTWVGPFEWDSAEMLDAVRNGTPVAPQAAQ